MKGTEDDIQYFKKTVKYKNEAKPPMNVFHSYNTPFGHARLSALVSQEGRGDYLSRIFHSSPNRLPPGLAQSMRTEAGRRGRTILQPLQLPASLTDFAGILYAHQTRIHF